MKRPENLKNSNPTEIPVGFFIEDSPRLAQCVKIPFDNFDTLGGASSDK